MDSSSRSISAIGARSSVAAPQYDLLQLIDRRIVRKVRPFARTLVRVLNSIPQNIYTGTMDLTNVVAGKLDEFGDALSGKNQQATDGGGHEFVQVTKAHYDYMERLRGSQLQEERGKYQLLASLAAAYKAAPPEKKDALLLTFFGESPALYVNVGAETK